MRPECYNHPPYPDGYWVRTGAVVQGGERAYPGAAILWGVAKPVYRWRRWVFSRGCKAYDTGDRATPAPILDGWDCAGCRWFTDEMERKCRNYSRA